MAIHERSEFSARCDVCSRQFGWARTRRDAKHTLARHIARDCDGAASVFAWSLSGSRVLAS